ncbi:MAG: glycosyltransferase [Caldilineaceae bacterium]|nr:glycosyltransferase [Caldilineaceae bacterium]
MKVLMIAPQPYFEPRGTPISVYQRLHGLAALGYEVDLLTYHIGKDVTFPGMQIHRIPPIPFIHAIKIGPSYAKLLLDLVLLLKAILMLWRNRYHAMHVHEEAGFFAMVLSRLFGVPYIYDMHSCLAQQLANSRYGRYPILVKIFEVLERRVLHTCDGLITIGADLEERAMAINNMVKHVRVENLPVHVTDPAPAPATVEQLRAELGLIGRTPIVYTGTFEPYQGLDLLFASAALVVQQAPHVCFVLVGGRLDQVADWKAEIAKQGLQDHVIFVGAVAPAETLAYLELAHILVSPRTTGLSVPLKVYTYMYAGKPIIATDIIAHSQVLDGTSALLVPSTKEAFADGIVKLMDDTTLRKQLGACAHEVAKQRFNSESYLLKLEWIYHAIPAIASGAVPAVHARPAVTKPKAVSE